MKYIAFGKKYWFVLFSAKIHFWSHLNQTKYTSTRVVTLLIKLGNYWRFNTKPLNRPLCVMAAFIGTCFELQNNWYFIKTKISLLIFLISSILFFFMKLNFLLNLAPPVPCVFTARVDCLSKCLEANTLSIKVLRRYHNTSGHLHYFLLQTTR